MKKMVSSASFLRNRLRGRYQIPVVLRRLFDGCVEGSDSGRGRNVKNVMEYGFSEKLTISLHKIRTVLFVSFDSREPKNHLLGFLFALFDWSRYVLVGFGVDKVACLIVRGTWYELLFPRRISRS